MRPKIDKERIKLEKDFREFIDSQYGRDSWKKYKSSALEGSIISFIRKTFLKKEIELKQKFCILEENMSFAEWFNIYFKEENNLIILKHNPTVNYTREFIIFLYEFYSDRLIVIN